MKKIIMLLMTVLILTPVALFAQDGNGGIPEFVFPAAVMAIVGGLAPSFIQIIVKAVKESWARYMIAVGISGIFGFLGILVFQRIEFSVTNLAIILPSFALPMKSISLHNITFPKRSTLITSFPR